MAESKASVNVSKNSLEQVRARLGSIAYKLEQDLDTIIAQLSVASSNWETSKGKELTEHSISVVEECKTDNKAVIDNIRKFLDTVKIQYSTAEKKLSSNADRFKK